MTDFRGPKVPLTAYVSIWDVEQVKAYASALGVSDSAWVAALIRKAFYHENPPGKPLPNSTGAILQAIAEEWLAQLPDGIRDEACKRVERRSRELSDEQRRGMLP